MKFFWAVLLLVVLACAGYVAFGRGGSAKPLVNAKPAPEIAPPMNYGVPWDESAFFDGASPAKPSVPTAPLAKEPASPAKATSDNAKTETLRGGPADAAKPGDEPAKKSEEAEKPADTKEPATSNPDVKKVEAETKKGAPSAATPVATTPKTPPVGGEPTATGTKDTPVVKDPPAAAATETKTESTEYTMVKQDDGSMLIDNKYTVRGDGTKESPYQINWEYLTSAEEVYQPRLGKKKLPGRLTMLNDHYVKISGYIAFPIMATEPTEMLTMLNQWDGCCIGVPPSPYDAIEVKLKKAAEGEERLASYGAVSGKIKVEPYLVKDWLVSLYLMDEGEITKK